MSATANNVMKLYNVPRQSKIRIVDKEIKTPPDSTDIDADDVLTFDHIDGMYSYCINNEGQVVHLAAWTEVEVLDNEPR